MSPVRGWLAHSPSLTADWEGMGSPTGISATSPRRLLAALGVVVVALVVAGADPMPTAAADSDDELAFVRAINEVRAELGLPELEPDEELAATAREHAATMAEADEIFHADPISEGFSGEWLKLGENVGVGAGVQVLMDAFIASPGHYANIVDPSFTHIGVGVVWNGDALYTTHRFLQPPIVERTDDPPVSSTTTPVDGPAPGPPTDDGGISVERVVALLSLLEDVG